MAQVLIVDDSIVQRGLIRNMLKAQGPDCPRCEHSRGCDGVWKSYAVLYGEDELVPVEKGGEPA